MSFTTDAARWRAISTRDPKANGCFVYLVKSTNIYCRATCPARLARRVNVGFSKNAAEAEAAGFRACKRCRPELITNEDPQDRAVAKACGLINDAVWEGDVKAVRLQELAKAVGLTPRYLHKIFKDKTGVSPKDFMRAKLQMGRSDGTASTSPEVSTDLPPLDIDAFDFNDLGDFAFDASPSSDDSLGFPVDELMLQGPYGNEIDVNVQLPALNLAGDAAPYAGFDGVYDQQLEWNSVCPRSDEETIATSATFELDAAFILGASGVSGFDEGTYRDLFV